MEQLYPFDSDLARSILKRYTKAADVIWVQEESENRGAWWFIRDRIQLVFTDRTVR